MEDPTDLFEFYITDRTEEADHKQTTDEKMHMIRLMIHLDPTQPLKMDPLFSSLNVEGISPGLEVR